MSDTATAQGITIEQRLEAMENMIVNLASTVQKVAIAQTGSYVHPDVAPPAEPEPVTETPSFTVIDGEAPAPPVVEPKSKAETSGPTLKTPDANATFRQLKALSALTAKTAKGGRIRYLGGDNVRSYWSFLTMQEAHDAIDALKGSKAFTFSNGLTVQPKR